MMIDVMLLEDCVLEAMESQSTSYISSRSQLANTNAILRIVILPAKYYSTTIYRIHLITRFTSTLVANEFAQKIPRPHVSHGLHRMSLDAEPSIHSQLSTGPFLSLLPLPRVT